MAKTYFLIFSFCLTNLYSQNPLFIPEPLYGTEFNLNVQNGTIEFFPGINTPTYGVNGNILGPTLFVDKWDWVTMHVTNNLTGTGNSTTMHWHGLHLPAEDDGGPHQLIAQGDTWSPEFQILNNAGTYWYHPHGAGKTDLQVSRGIAGMIIVRDSSESSLNLPRNYGVDDFPLVVQTKAFDILYQIAISTNDDTVVCVNATTNPYLNAPAQVVRLRLLNGSSMRVFNFGLSDNIPFSLIGTDGGLLNNSLPMTRILVAPGERAEILVDLQGMQGQTIYIKSYASEIPDNYYGAATVSGMMGGEIPGYDLNPLNGTDFNILQINIVEQSADPVTIIPDVLIDNAPIMDYDTVRNFILQADDMMDADAQVEGPFNINGDHFNMDILNQTINLNSTEKWHIINNTGIAHPFHIHDVQFTIDNINGGIVPDYLQGNKDVVVVPPMQYVDVIMQFKDFANNSIPYMYHCHMLHHEDDGMMGSFVVIDTSLTSIVDADLNSIYIYPNPVFDQVCIEFNSDIKISKIQIVNSIGEIVMNVQLENNILDLTGIPSGLYKICFITDDKIFYDQIIKI